LIKTKLITVFKTGEGFNDKLDDKINEFISDNSIQRVLDIKLSSSYSSGGFYMLLTALIIYDIGEGKHL